MATVTVTIEPEECSEGTYGHKTIIEKHGVVLIEDLEQVFLAAAKGGGWVADTVYVGSDYNNG